MAGVVPVAEPDTRLRRVDAISLTTGVVDLRPRRAPTIAAVLSVIALIISAVLSLICLIRSRWRDNLVLDLRDSGVISGILFCLEAELSRSTKRNVENIIFFYFYLSNKKNLSTD